MGERRRRVYDSPGQKQEQWSRRRYGRYRDWADFKKMVASEVAFISPVSRCAYLETIVGINTVNDYIAKWATSSLGTIPSMIWLTRSYWYLATEWNAFRGAARTLMNQNVDTTDPSSSWHTVTSAAAMPEIESKQNHGTKYHVNSISDDQTYLLWCLPRANSHHQLEFFASCLGSFLAWVLTTTSLKQPEALTSVKDLENVLLSSLYLYVWWCVATVL